jgi:hypothetical protein
MDLYGGTMLLPYIKIFDKINEGLKFSFDHLIQPSINEVSILHLSVQVSVSMSSLFYDGKWQGPVKGTYWKHNDYIWANAKRYECTFLHILESYSLFLDLTSLIKFAH